MPRPLLLALLGWGSLLLLPPALPGAGARAQAVHLLVHGDLATLDGERWGGFGASGALSFAGYAFDVVAHGAHHPQAWRAGAAAPSSLWTVGLGLHANLPELAYFIRPYVGVGPAYVFYGRDSRLGLEAKAGTYVRTTSDRLFPYVQATYLRLADTDASPDPLRALSDVSVQGGLRVAL